MYYMPEYRLTDEGEHYLKEGLPEKNLIDLLRKGSVPLTEAERQIENFNVALMWAKRNGWIELKFNDLVLSKPPEVIPGQDALDKINKGEPVPQDMLGMLIQRKLVEKIKSELEEAKRLAGKEVLYVTRELMKTGVWRQVKFKPYDVTVPGRKMYAGKIHPYRQIIDDVREKLIGLGFVEEKGPFVELNFFNADALFMPSDHPARGIHDVFSVKEPKEGKLPDRKLVDRVRATHENGWATGSRGWGLWDVNLARKIVLRSQNTAISARVMSRLKKENIPYKMFAIDKVFRPDVIDAKHLIEFDQCEGIVVGEDLSFKNLLGYLKEIALSFGAEKVKFKPSYFPFTEPSVEGYVYFPKFGWVEVEAAGMFRPEVTRPLGIDVPVLAWGLGMSRLAMLKLGVDDIRYLYSDNLDWLRNKEVVM